MIQFVDMHMHMGFVERPQPFARQLADLGVAAFSNTVTVREYERLHVELRDDANVRIGLGLHPWWVGPEGEGDLDDDLARFDALLETTRFVGEVGLDFLPQRSKARDEQLRCFEHIVKHCASMGGKVISMHAVRSEDAVLGILERSSCLKGNVCVLHSFGGSSAQLSRAIDDGILFSVGPRMLAKRRGKEYARVIPLEHLLVETDMPASEREQCAPYDLERELRQVIDEIADLRGVKRESLAQAILRTSSEILGLQP